jgi:peroxin-5
MMYGGGGYGMQRPMMFQSGLAQQPEQQQYEGKGKGRVQELSDTDWEKQFEELSTVDKDAHLDQLDREAQEAIERELNQADR